MTEKMPNRKIKIEEQDSKDDFEENEDSYKELFSTQKVAFVKIETNQPINEVEQVWLIKKEELDPDLDIKGNLRENSTRFKESISKQIEALVKVEIDQPINNFKEMHSWSIKKEELDIKEDLEENNTSISTGWVGQDNQVKCEGHTPEKSNQLDDEISLKSISYRKLPKSDPCVDKNVEETSFRRLHLQHKYREESKPGLLSPKEVKMFKCNKCDYQTKHKRNLKCHLLWHNPEQDQKFKCDQCSYKTFLKTRLNRHLLRHRNPEEVEMVKCTICGFQTKYKHHLKTHLLQHNPEQGPSLKCDQCSYKTFLKTRLKIHLLRHRNPEDVEMFKCNNCDFQTKYKHHLKTHLLRHNPGYGQNFKCNQCSYKTFLATRLNAHLLRHKNTIE